MPNSWREAAPTRDRFKPNGYGHENKEKETHHPEKKEMGEFLGVGS